MTVRWLIRRPVALRWRRFFGRVTPLAILLLLPVLAAAQDDGPDLLVGDLQSVMRFGRVGDITAYSVGTNACNIGDMRVQCIASTNEHPVTAQNMYRLKNGRFEQIGMSWLVHWFYAVSQSLCGPCNDPTDGSALGVGCSTPDSAWLNGIQVNMSRRSDVNAHTGVFPYSLTPFDPNTLLDRRLQVHDADLDPALNEGALYFIEGHYIAWDDATYGNGNNNVAYRPVSVGQDPNHLVTSTGQTQRGQAAIRAWQDTDPAVTETDIQVPGEGLFILAAKATELGDGYWHYEYALQNLNSDRSAGSFRIPINPYVRLRDMGFHDVDYHSGEIYDLTDWPPTIADGAITWSTQPYDGSANANALRFSTLYNFRFDANAAPVPITATIGLFKPGLPTDVAASTIGPTLDVIDCNSNDIADECDLDCEAPDCGPPCGGSVDCNTNGVPDECEADCNGNGVADACDIANCPPGELWCADCNTNGVPDECEADCDGDGVPDDCETPEDTDGDGVYDCFDLCSCTPGVCVCPAVDRCCFLSGLCLEDYPRDVCLAQGGTPDCDVEPPCEDGCLTASPDCNQNGLADTRDLACGEGEDCNPPCGGSFDCNTNDVPDECELDTDADAVIDACDNCSTVENANQDDADDDGFGDACDNCRQVESAGQTDSDQDGIGNLCDGDFDQSGFCNVSDLLMFLDAFGHPLDASDCPEEGGTTTGPCAVYDLNVQDSFINVSDLLKLIGSGMFGTSTSGHGCAPGDDGLVHCPLP